MAGRPVTATRLRSPPPRDHSAAAVALRRYVAAPVNLAELVISFDRSVLPGYAWVFPLGDGWFNMGCGVFHRGRRASRINLRDTFTAFTERFPTARAIWRQRTDAVTALVSVVSASRPLAVQESMGDNAARRASNAA